MSKKNTEKKILLKTPKGTVDLVNKECELLLFILKKAEEIMKLYGPPLDTPIFELSDILLKKYDTTEDEYMNTYQLELQGKEKHTLRFDLTVPFARFLAQNKISKFSRYQIGKVFRRDQPVLSKGRYREFYQCDFDIAGNYIEMTSEAQILLMTEKIINQFQIGPFTIKINDRRILNKLLNKFTIKNEFEILSTIDKIKKIKEEDFIKELQEKKLSKEDSLLLLKIIKNKGDYEFMLRFLKKQEYFQCEEIIREYEILKEYLIYQNMDISLIEFDMSLARGAAYYTGLIFEVEFIEEKYKEIGSVLGGGRYDNLVSSFNKNMNIPAIGLSLGVYRILSILKNKDKIIKKKILICSLKSPMIKERLEFISKLREEGISCHTNFINRLNLSDQMKYAKKNDFSCIVLLKEEEYKDNKIRIIKDIENIKEEIIEKETIIEYLFN